MIKPPKKRSKVRIYVGHWYFKIKKNISWFLSKDALACTKRTENLEYLIFQHRTPLLRKLRNVDMHLQYNKIDNLKIALKNLDGLIVEPEKIFSYWYLIKNPTKKRGYKEGMLLSNGQVKTGLGGGLCQLSNLIYWMTLHTPLTIVERWRHSYDVFPDVNRSQPFGSGATCSYPNIDLQIKNKTHQKFQLKLTIVDGYLQGEWRSDKALNVKYEIFEKDEKIIEYFGNYIRHNQLHRTVTDEKGEMATEFITENNAIMMYNPLLEGNKR